MADHGYDCAGVVSRRGHVGRCSREATRHFERADGTCVAHYCAQHARGAGVMRMLLPFPWEYKKVSTYRKDA